MTVPINKKNLKKILKFNSSFNKYIIYEQNFYNKQNFRILNSLLFL
jgi:hypothetical protein